MAKTTAVILLERIDPHGKMGEVVHVKPGFARNYLLPQRKALRATPANLAYFEGQRKDLEAQNAARIKEAEQIAKKLEGTSLILIRQASDKGHLYGSVSSRDISEELETQGHAVARSMVNLNNAVKEIGLFQVEIILHPEVRLTIEVNVARNNEEAKVQKKTGVAIIADAGETTDDVIARAERQMQDLLEEDALASEKERQEEQAAADEEAKAKADAKSQERAAKKAAKAVSEEGAEEEAAEEASAQEAEKAE